MSRAEDSVDAEWALAHDVAMMRDQIMEFSRASSINPRELVAAFHGVQPCPGGGWWAIWGYIDPTPGAGDVQTRAWRITKKGAERTAKRKAARLFTIRMAVVEAEMSGS